jgi:hypothetical protein
VPIAPLSLPDEPEIQGFTHPALTMVALSALGEPKKADAGSKDMINFPS